MQENTKRRSKVRFNELYQLPVVLCNATSRSGEGACFNHDVGSVSNKGKPLKLRHYDISRAHFQGTAQRLICIKLPEEDRQKYGEDKVGKLVKSMYGKMFPTSVNLIT